MWELDFALLNALCEISDELHEEGWTGIEELRKELIDELQRARRQREEQYQKKQERETD